MKSILTLLDNDEFNALKYQYFHFGISRKGCFNIHVNSIDTGAQQQLKNQNLGRRMKMKKWQLIKPLLPSNSSFIFI